jgi:hypothetical protein
LTGADEASFSDGIFMHEGHALWALLVLTLGMLLAVLLAVWRFLQR